VDFNTIEGKTSFLEKVLLLIALVTYDTYQQQLLEGVAQVIGQSIHNPRNPHLQNQALVAHILW
jgi:DNA primase